jgi:hypothetical protein
VYDAADHALAARALGVRVDDEDATVGLLLDAVSRSALSAAFAAAKRHLDAANGECDSNGPDSQAEIIGASGGDVVWMKEHRATYLRFLHFHRRCAACSSCTANRLKR